MNTLLDQLLGFKLSSWRPGSTHLGVTGPTAHAPGGNRATQAGLYIFCSSHLRICGIFCYNDSLKKKIFFNEPNLYLYFYDMHLAPGCFVLTTYLCPDAALASPSEDHKLQTPPTQPSTINHYLVAEERLGKTKTVWVLDLTFRV